MIQLYTKVIQVTLDHESKQKLDMVAGLGAGATVRQWIKRDLPKLHDTFMPRPYDARPAKFMLRTTENQWAELSAKAKKMYTYPARLIRQIIVNELKRHPDQQKLLK